MIVSGAPVSKALLHPRFYMNIVIYILPNFVGKDKKQNVNYIYLQKVRISGKMINTKYSL